MWNGFFSDISTCVAEDGQQAQVFADDLKVDGSCPTAVSSDILKASLKDAQHRAHIWGARNRVCFDPNKEAIRIIHPVQGDTETFVLLGVLFDCQLSMVPCLDGLLSQLRAKVFALVKIQHIYDIPSLLNMFKVHIWSKMKYYSGALLIAEGGNCVNWTNCNVVFCRSWAWTTDLHL